MSKKNTSLVLVRPAEYFHGAVSGAVAQLKVRATEQAQSYLVSVLTKFLTAENLFAATQEGQKSSTLVSQLSDALEEESPELKVERFRHMGDYSLYIAGFFSESLSRKLVDVDYYIGMGGGAYEAVASLKERKDDAKLFSELATKFPQFVDVLAQVSEESSIPSQSNDLLRAYDLWAKTGSDRLAKRLRKAGIVLDKARLKKTGSES